MSVKHVLELLRMCGPLLARFSKPSPLLAYQPRCRVHVQANNGTLRKAVGSVVRVRETVLSDVAVRFDFPHDMVPDMGSTETSAIELLRKLAVDFVPRPADAGSQIPPQRIDEVRELLRVISVLPTASDGQP